MTTIEHIETAGPDRRARRLLFDDGTPPLTTSAAVIKALDLEAGAQWDREVLAERVDEVARKVARDRAMQYVASRERSVHELRSRLLRDGYSAAMVSEIVDRYTELQIVDDTRYAESWVRQRIAAGYGPRRIAQELSQRGIDPQLVAEVVRSAGDDEVDDVSRARASLKGARPHDRKDRERLIRRLVGRGFSLGVALEAVESGDDHEMP